jgi:hypothetical protein
MNPRWLLIPWKNSQVSLRLILGSLHRSAARQEGIQPLGASVIGSRELQVDVCVRARQVAAHAGGKSQAALAASRRPRRRQAAAHVGGKPLRV